MEPLWPKKLLVVEDAPDIRLLLQKLFELEGYEVATACDGAEALALLGSSARLPDLILLDLMMPVMDGYEFRAKQKEKAEWAEIPVVVMTADGDVPADRVPLEASGYLRKPSDLQTLLASVERHSRRPAVTA